MSRKKGVLLLICVLLGGVAWVLYQYLVAHGFSAREKPNAIETFIARHVRSLALRPDYRRLKNPIKPTPLVVAEARDHFADHCALCHGNRGDGKTMIISGLYPAAPDLRSEETQQLPDGAIFYIIQNGIRFTGMPGWGGTDDENWKLVLFIRHLPEFSEKELELMKEVNGQE